LLLAERLVEEGAPHAEAWNFGPASDAPVTNAELADQLVAHWGSPARWEQDQEPGPHEAAILQVDSAKARSRLGWKPRLSVQQATQWAVEWYSAYYRRTDVASVSRDHLIRYQHSVQASPHG
jgi:CDP-glucose 4,6-dehydratase